MQQDSGQSPNSRVIPLLFGVAVEAIPAPLRHLTAYNGEALTDMKKLLARLQAPSGRTVDLPRIARHVAAFIRDGQQAITARVSAHPVKMRLPEHTSVHFVNRRFSSTFEPWRGQISNGVRLYSAKFTGDAHQQWLLCPVRKGVYRICTLDRTHCISIEDDLPREGAAILLWQYEDGNESQHWRFAHFQNTAPQLGTIVTFNCATKDTCLMPRLSDGQLVLKTWRNYLDQDWWILAPPVLDRLWSQG